MQMKTTVFSLCLSGDLRLPSNFNKCLNPGPRPVPRNSAGVAYKDPASGPGAEEEEDHRGKSIVPGCTGKSLKNTVLNVLKSLSSVVRVSQRAEPMAERRGLGQRRRSLWK
jgi:hypothetical protein